MKVWCSILSKHVPFLDCDKQVPMVLGEDSVTGITMSVLTLLGTLTNSRELKDVLLPQTLREMWKKTKQPLLWSGLPSQSHAADRGTWKALGQLPSFPWSFPFQLHSEHWPTRYSIKLQNTTGTEKRWERENEIKSTFIPQQKEGN